MNNLVYHPITAKYMHFLFHDSKQENNESLVEFGAKICKMSLNSEIDLKMAAKHNRVFKHSSNDFPLTTC